MNTATRPAAIDLDGLVDLLRRAPAGARRFVAIAGAPGSGKSSFTATLCERLNHDAPDFARIVAMDGFHFDDRVLEARGQRARKGAPHTFDVDGLAALLTRLHADDGREIAVPVFDRTLEIARAGAAIVPPATRVLLVEGNYLLLDAPAWAPLRPLFDLTVMLEVPRAVIVERLLARWQGYGLAEQALRSKMEDNDLPNADLVMSRSVAADWVVRNG